MTCNYVIALPIFISVVLELSYSATFFQIYLVVLNYSIKRANVCFELTRLCTFIFLSFPLMGLDGTKFCQVKKICIVFWSSI